MIDIDRDRLHSDLAYRIAFARQFIGVRPGPRSAAGERAQPPPLHPQHR